MKETQGFIWNQVVKRTKIWNEHKGTQTHSYIKWKHVRIKERNFQDSQVQLQKLEDLKCFEILEQDFKDQNVSKLGPFYTIEKVLKNEQLK
jgi:hypothetical protein